MWNHECEHKTSQRSRKTQGISIWGHSQYIFFKKAKKKKKKKETSHYIVKGSIHQEVIIIINQYSHSDILKIHKTK